MSSRRNDELLFSMFMFFVLCGFAFMAFCAMSDFYTSVKRSNYAEEFGRACIEKRSDDACEMHGTIFEGEFTGGEHVDSCYVTWEGHCHTEKSVSKKSGERK